MGKNRKKRHFMDETYGKIRKPMPPVGRVIEDDKGIHKRKKWDHRDWIDEEDDE